MSHQVFKFLRTQKFSDLVVQLSANLKTQIHPSQHENLIFMRT